MKYISIDIETTGLNPDVNQMIEFAAVLEDTENPLPVEGLPQLRILLPHDEYIINSYCIKLHSELFKTLGKLTYSEWETLGGDFYSVRFSKIFVESYARKRLCKIFTSWLEANGYSDKKIVVAGKNFNGFDANFLKNYMPTIKFHHRVLDPMALFIKSTDKLPPSLDECAKRAGVSFKEDGYHTALSDAMMVIELLREGWKND